MAPPVATRLRLAQLEEAIRTAEEAVKKVQEAERALEDQEANRRQRGRLYDSDEISVEDEEVEGTEEDEDEGNKKSARSEEETIQDKASIDADEEELDYETRQERLEEKKNMCMREVINAYKAFVTEFEVYSKLESLESLTQLHSSIHTKLPIELREMIYSYLDIQGPAYANDPTKHFPIFVGQGGFDPNFHDSEDSFLRLKIEQARRVFESGTFDSLKPGGWLLNHEYVGHGMARDIAEIFYSVNDFSMNINELREFLISDPTRTGLKPFEYIRHKVIIHIPTTFCNGGSERAWQTTENEIEFLNGLYAQLNDLMLITQQSHISVELWLSTSAPNWVDPEIGERRFYNIMESVRAPIYHLIHTGVKILVIHQYMRSGCSLTISEDPLNYFFMSKEEWETEKRGHGSNWMPSMNFITQEAFYDRTKEQGSMKRQLKKLMKQRWGHEDYEILEG